MALLVVPPSPRGAPPVPTTLHVGSGKNFQPAWLNLDVDPRWRPDFVFDLNQPLPADGRLAVSTHRFGAITLAGDCFDEIVAQDVLEHIRDLPTAMTTLLHWLRVGGVLKVAVPYELSLGAWCDPTHVRAFNERSFDYFTKWSWYLGWRTHHFGLRHMEFVASPFGQELSAQGRSLEEVLRTPRAVDQIYVELEKRPLDAAGRAATDFYFERPLG
ncbi:MAG: hypothetical protein JNM25_16060 [Planctomycetes bacterium]|nr:hypothetical protein [Planctomycetota bacterium]